MRLIEAKLDFGNALLFLSFEPDIFGKSNKLEKMSQVYNFTFFTFGKNLAQSKVPSVKDQTKNFFNSVNILHFLPALESYDKPKN